MNLTYTSGDGNGPFGLGNHLTLPQISRKTTKGLPLYDESDSFLLTTAEDLIPVENGVRQLSQDGIEYLVISYRPRLEGLFAVIEQWIGPLQSHWRLLDKNNVTSFFGKTAGARIADPENPTRIFQWLLQESFDAHGNHIVYEYKAENTDNVSAASYESNRSQTANRYIERIKYGNTVPYPDSLSTSNTWNFEVVFDYGEYRLPPEEPSPYQPRQDWSSRQDPHSTYHAGFEIRTHRLCRRILMFHHVEELGADPVLVHATRFHYLEGTTASFLTQVESIGFRFDSGQYQSQSLPPLEFGYTGFNPGKQRFELLQEPSGQPLAGLEHHPEYLLVDLYGEGVPGILYSDGRTTYYREPQADGYAQPEAPSTLPIDSYGQGMAQRLMDLTGDGQLDLVVSTGARTGYYEAKPDRSWSDYQTLPAFPNDFHNPHNFLADLTGNGLADVVLIENAQVRLYPSLGKNGFATPISRVRDAEPPVPANPDVREVWQFADMLGAGTPQLVHIRNGLVECWPSLGYGRFGEPMRLDNAPQFEPDLDVSRLFLADLDGFGPADLIYVYADRVEIFFNQSGNAFSKTPLVVELPENWDPLAQISFVDLKGNGTTCLVFSQYHPTPRHWYCDFSAGHKPYLLNQIDNHLGAVTTISYCSSTRFYLQDKQNGTPWIVNLPFPVQIVEKVEHIDQISGTRLVSTYAYHHGYYDGEESEFRGFGMVERQDAEMLGADAQPTDVPPVLTKTWYHIGAWEQQGPLSRRYEKEYFQGDAHAYRLPDSLFDYADYQHQNPGYFPDDDAWRGAFRSLKGAVLRQEVYGLDGTSQQDTPYSVSETNYRTALLQPKGQNRYGVYFVHAQESLSYDYERQAQDPRVHHEFVLKLDEWGNVLRSCAVAYGRRGGDALPEQASLKITAEEDNFINQTGADIHLLGMPWENKAYEIKGLTLGEGKHYFSLDEVGNYLDQALTSLGDEARLLGWQRHYYYNPNDDQAYPLGQCGPQALPMYTEAAAFAPGEVEQAFDGKMASQDLNGLLTAEGGYRQDATTGYWWNKGTETHYLGSSQFFLSESTVDVFGHQTTYGYDRHHLLPVKVTDALGNQTTVEAIDYHGPRVQRIQDPNGNISEALFDPLGQVIVTSHYGTEAGQAVGFKPLAEYSLQAMPTQDQVIARPETYLQQTASFFYYDLFAWQNHQQPVHAVSLAAENYPGAAASPIRIAIAYNDGFGRALQSTANVEPGKAYVIAADGSASEQDSPTRWLTTGRVVYNNKGLSVKQYQPFYSADYRYIDNPTLNSFGVSSTLHFDPLGRPVRVDTPKGFFTKVEFNAWTERHYDENDTLLDSPYYKANISQPDKKSPYYNPLLSEAEKQALAKAALFNDTYSEKRLDNLGRTIQEVQCLVTLKDTSSPEAEGPSRSLITHHEWDIQGHQVASADPRLGAAGKENFRVTYALNGMALKTVSVDAGTHWLLLNAVGNPIYSQDSRGFVGTTRYDALHRTVEHRIQGGNGANALDNVVEKLFYGDSLDEQGKLLFPDPAQHNLKGRLVQHYDPAGLVSIEAYNLLGLPLTTTRQLRKDYKSEADWQDISAAALGDSLESATYTFNYQYDALGRVTTETNPDGNSLRPVYHLSGHLQQVRLDQETYVQDIQYNAKGQRFNITYGNGVSTCYKYEATTFRLTNIQSQRANAHKTLQDLAYTYDPVGNVAYLADTAWDIVYNANQQIKPESEYTYDSLYRLTAATGREHTGQSGGKEFPPLQPLGNDQALQNYTRAFQYDDGGNLVTIQHQAANSANSYTRKLTVACGSTMSNRAVDSDFTADPEKVDGYFDHAGNQTQLAGLKSIRWNYRNRLACAVVIERPDTPDAEYYVYDSTGQRVRKISESYGNGGSIAHVEETIYLGGFEIKRILQNGDIKEERHSVRIMDGQSAIATRIEWKQGTPPDGVKNNLQVRYALDDHLGSTTLEVDGAGKIIGYEIYYPYGGTALSAGRSEAEVKLKQYRYSGKERDSVTGLYYYGARYYAPWLGRWISADPAGTVDGLNLYGFVKNNPLSYLDSKGTARTKAGRFAKRGAEIGTAIGAGIGAVIGAAVGYVLGAGLGAVIGLGIGAGAGAALGAVIGGLIGRAIGKRSMVNPLTSGPLSPINDIHFGINTPTYDPTAVTLPGVPPGFQAVTAGFGKRTEIIRTYGGTVAEFPWNAYLISRGRNRPAPPAGYLNVTHTGYVQGYNATIAAPPLQLGGLPNPKARRGGVQKYTGLNKNTPNPARGIIEGIRYSKGSLVYAATHGHVHFHLDEMGNNQAILDILNKQGPHSDAVTSSELRYLKRFWINNPNGRNITLAGGGNFQFSRDNVTLYRNAQPLSLRELHALGFD